MSRKNKYRIRRTPRQKWIEESLRYNTLVGVEQTADELGEFFDRNYGGLIGAFRQIKAKNAEMRRRQLEFNMGLRDKP